MLDCDRNWGCRRPPTVEEPSLSPSRKRAVLVAVATAVSALRTVHPIRSCGIATSATARFLAPRPRVGAGAAVPARSL